MIECKTKTTRFAYFSIVGIIIVAILLAAICATPRDPCFNGRSLDSWLDDLARPGVSYSTHAEAADAVKKMGTNAIPKLLEMLTSEDSAIRKICIKLLSKQKIIRSRMIPATERYRKAFLGFKTLGSS